MSSYTSDLLRVLDERWRDWALDMQDTSDDPRRKR